MVLDECVIYVYEVHGYSICGKDLACVEKSSDSWSIVRREVQIFLNGGFSTLPALTSHIQYMHVAELACCE